MRKIKVNFFHRNPLIPNRGEISIDVNSTWDFMRFIVPLVPRRKNTSMSLPMWKIVSGAQRKWKPYLEVLQRVTRKRKALRKFREVRWNIYWPPGKAGRTRLPDDDSMHTGLIGVRDMLKHLGLIYDDSPKWYNGEIILQKSKDAGTSLPYTEIVIWTKKV